MSVMRRAVSRSMALMYRPLAWLTAAYWLFSGTAPLADGLPFAELCSNAAWDDGTRKNMNESRTDRAKLLSRKEIIKWTNLTESHARTQSLSELMIFHDFWKGIWDCPCKHVPGIIPLTLKSAEQIKHNETASNLYLYLTSRILSPVTVSDYLSSKTGTMLIMSAQAGLRKKNGSFTKHICKKLYNTYSST